MIEEIIYDKISPLTVPTGYTYSAQELKDLGYYSQLFDSDCVITLENGVFVSYVPLDRLKKEYEITEKNPQKALDLIIQKREDLKDERVKEYKGQEQLALEIDDIQKQLDIQANALEELIIMTLEGAE